MNSSNSSNVDPRDQGDSASSSWRRGSIGTSHVWDEARRAAHRTGAPLPEEAAPAADFSAERLCDIVGLAVSSTVRDLLPGLDEETATRIDAELRGRIADLLEGGELPESDAAPEAAPQAPEPPQRIPLPPEAIDPILANRIRKDFDRLGVSMHAMKVLRETAITVILETLGVERRKLQPEHDSALTPGERARIDNLERRIAKLTSSIAKTRAALAKIADMEDFDPGVPSIYREVQGLTPVDEAYRVKRELLADIFEANVKLQGDLRELRPEDERREGGLDLDGPRRSRVA